ncbi:MAG TPA: hypothetical protein VGP94_03040, partial [Tepidisphaeraceae bacterium]|nr:hypothetical protein [Tepidisphaeraceae bacterium]
VFLMLGVAILGCGILMVVTDSRNGRDGMSPMAALIGIFAAVCFIGFVGRITASWWWWRGR